MHSHSNGQNSSPLRSAENRRHEKQDFDQNKHRNLELFNHQSDHDYCKISLWPDWSKYLSGHSKGSSECMLQTTVFLQICNKLGYPEIGLFASHLWNQLPSITWKPVSHSLATNALQQKWGQLLYGFPLSYLIQRILKKIREKLFQ